MNLSSFGSQLPSHLPHCVRKELELNTIKKLATNSKSMPHILFFSSVRSSDKFNEKFILLLSPFVFRFILSHIIITRFFRNFNI